MIDKYAGLLEMLLSQKSLSSPQQQLIKDAHQSINRSAERLKRVNLLRGLNSLDDFADVYLFEHHKSNCCFSWFSSTPTKAYQNLLLWFEDLTQEAFSTKELLGAVYAIRSQIGKLRDEEERAAIRDGLDKILKDNACPAFSIDAAKGELREYIEAFNGRMKELKIRWPAPFAEEEAPAFLLEQRA